MNTALSSKRRSAAADFLSVHAIRVAVTRAICLAVIQCGYLQLAPVEHNAYHMP